MPSRRSRPITPGGEGTRAMSILRSWPAVCDLVRIDSPSLHERRVITALRDALAEMGIYAEEDNAAAGRGRGGQPDRARPRCPGAPRAHQRACGHRGARLRHQAQVEGTSAARRHHPRRGRQGQCHHHPHHAAAHSPRRPHAVEVVFTVAEEIGYGARALDYDHLRARMGIVLDGRRTGVITSRPRLPLAWVRGVAATPVSAPSKGLTRSRSPRRPLLRCRWGTSTTRPPRISV